MRNAWKSHIFGKLQTTDQTVHAIIHVTELYKLYLNKNNKHRHICTGAHTSAASMYLS